MQYSGLDIRKNYSIIWEASHRVVGSHGIAGRATDKRQLHWRSFLIVSLRPMPVRNRSRRLSPTSESSIASRRQKTVDRIRATVDLIMVAQALHWFDLERFYAEARRVLKSDGVLAASAYNLLHIEPVIDEVVNRYYYEVVGPFWPPGTQAR